MYLSVNDANARRVNLENGTSRTVMAYNEQLMIVRFEFKKGQIGDQHSHPHVQSTYVAKGKFEFTVDGEKILCQEGDTLIAEMNSNHGCICLEDGILIDNFTPYRKDFL